MRLTVKQLKNRDPGSRLAVIDREQLADLGVSSGDFVAIEGRDGERAVAQVWPSDSSDAGRGIVRIDGQLRQAAGVGESEKGVREVFSKARENAPAVVFFDEIDAIASERGHDVGDSGVGERVVSQLLTELDWLEALEDVVVITTTNRPDLIDNALLRPGRLDQHVEVADPDTDARREIFAIPSRDRPLADDVDLEALAEQTAGYVGADIEAVCREAATIAVREHVQDAEESAVEEIELTMAHFEDALDAVDVEGGSVGDAEPVSEPV